SKVKEAIQTHESFKLEYRIIKKNGDVRWFHESGKPIISEEGDINSIDGVILDITERKEIEKQLKQSEQKYRRVIDSMGDAINVLDTDLRYILVNKALKKWVQKLGFTSDLIGNRMPDIFPFISQKTIKEYREVIKTGKPLITTESTEVNNRIIHTETRKIPIKIDNRVDQILAIVRDITKRKKAEQNLKRSEEKYKALSEELEIIFDNIPDLIFYKDTKGNFLRVNKYYAEKLGYTKEKLEGKSVFNFYPHEIANQYWENDLEVIESGKPKLNFEEEWITSKGKRWLLTSLIPIKNDENNVIGIIGIGKDITGRKLTEIKLKESEEKFRTLVEEAPDVIFTVDKNYKILFINDPPAGLSREEVIGTNTLDYTHPEYIDVAKESIDKVFATGKPSSFQIKARGPNDTVSWYSTRLRAIKRGNKVKSVLLITRDITDQKSVENNLIEINRLKSELLRRTSHELKTPLVSIKGFTSLLLELHRDKLDVGMVSTLKEIEQGCFRLENLINDILKTSELDSGKTVIKKSWDDLAFLIRYSISELQGFIALRKHKISLNVSETLVTNFEKEQVHLVLSNLLTNAIKYTPPGGKIKISAEDNNERTLVKIKDNGIGLTEKEKALIFKQFGKIERYGQGLNVISEGTGLGLYISKKIIELHGGKIWAESEGRNKGTIFFFTLPKK
ncbi:MAG: PAS domain S-box protein, partial [Candidatus Lokiarchaeota archaeon]|nr:PAS domain S-box protein [Candidatus Lokiarchaeota archaeon]MBD3338347.1 PAS domain S-box protein [Candidatus Lokiarchaeota archaeon]